MFQKVIGGAGYRSRYLSHAKRALYHLSYAPVGDSAVFLTVLKVNVCQGRLLRIVKVTELDQWCSGKKYVHAFL